MEEKWLTIGHGVLVVTEVGQALGQKIPPEAFGLLRGDRIIETLQAAVMTGETPLDQRQHITGDGIRLDT